MDHGGPCIPLNRFRGTTSNTVRLTALKKPQDIPSTPILLRTASSSKATQLPRLHSGKDIVAKYINQKKYEVSPASGPLSASGSVVDPISMVECAPISPTPSSEVVEFDPSSRFVTPGSSGGTFSARGQLVAVTLPSLHNEYYVPTRASKKQPITTQRFLPDKNVIITPGLKLSTRERLRIEGELLEEAKQRNRMTQLIPHRAQQPYLMAGFPITLQERAASGSPSNEAARHSGAAALLPPQSSLVNEPEQSQSKAAAAYSLSKGIRTVRSHSLAKGISTVNIVNALFTLAPNGNIAEPGAADQSAISLPGQSYASDIFLTQPPSQTTLDPIIGVDEMTVTPSQFNNYRSPCSLLGRDKVNALSAEFKKIAQDLVTLGYSHAEQLVEDCKDPSHAVQVLDLNGDGFVDIKEYIVVMALSQHYFRGSDIFFDQDKVEAKIKHLKGKFEELENPSLQASLHGFSRLLISDDLMSDIMTALNCDPTGNLTFIEYICIFMFWEELEDIILEQDLSGDIEISSYITAYLGASDSTFSFDEALSSTFLTAE